MRNFIFSGFFLLITMFSCQNKEVLQGNEIDSQDYEEYVGLEADVKANSIAFLEVDGMMCQKGCGSIIRKGLYETGGVETVEVNFEDEDSSNEIKVYFDNEKISPEEIIAAIANLEKNRYSAKLTKVVEI